MEGGRGFYFKLKSLKTANLCNDSLFSKNCFVFFFLPIEICILQKFIIIYMFKKIYVYVLNTCTQFSRNYNLECHIVLCFSPCGITLFKYCFMVFVMY